MKLLSWNVNGLKNAMKKGPLIDLVKSNEYDVLMFQEIKTDKVPEELENLGYEVIINPAKQKGYSGVMTLTRLKPKSVELGIGVEEFDSEGRIISMEFDDYYIINVYFPNAGEGLKRLDFKLRFDEAFERYALSKGKPLIICGDFNVAHTELDLARPKENVNHAGFTPQEREWFDKFLKLGFVDTFRMFVKEGGHYTYWTYRFHAREKNIGWRIDYCVVSESLKEKVRASKILKDVMGSDHAPIVLEIEL